MDHRIGSSSDGVDSLRRAGNGTGVSNPRDTSPLLANIFEQERPVGSGRAETLIMSSGDDSEWMVPILRASALAVIAFQLAYTILDGADFSQTFARTLPFHIANMTLVAAGIIASLSPTAMRHWRAITLVVSASILFGAMQIAVIDRDGHVLVTSIVLLFFGAGALIPWNPRWQAALEAAGALALFGYAMQTPDPSPRLAIAWMLVLSAAVLSQLSAIHSARHRAKLDEKLSALAENHRLLAREMELREDLARAREIEFNRRKQSESMLRKVFEASPDNIAINVLSDGRFIAVNDDYQVAGYTRDDVIGTSVIKLGLWPDEQEMTQFVESLRKTGRVKNMPVALRRKDGVIETHLFSASIVDVDGEACVVSMSRDITDQERAKTRLRNSHAALRKILHATLDVIVVSRVSDGSYIDFNHQFGVSGFTPDDLESARAPSPRVFKDVEQQKALRQVVLTEGVVRNVEVDFLMPDGKTTPTVLSALRVELDGEDCVVTMIRDISAAKEASRKLEENAKAVRDIFDLSPDAISVSRMSDGKFVAFNDEFLRLTGHSRERVTDSSADEIGLWTDPADRTRVTEALALNGMFRNLELEFQTASQSRVPTLVSASTINFGSEPCVVAYIRDITLIKRTELDLLAAREELSRQVKALVESEETFRKLFEANLDSITLIGADGIYINVNREFVRASGYSREDAIGHHFSELNLWIHPDEMINFANELIYAKQVRNLEVAFRNKDGSERPVLISAVTLELHGQQCCLTISRDIADIKMTQRELVAAREAALAASRAKSEFLSSMSHEIRTPMNAILGMADLLAETALGDEQRRYVNTVIGNGNALLELINGILDLAKVESGRISLEAVEFDPREVTEKVVETLAIRANEKGIELRARFAPSVPSVAIGDPLRLGQILINLVGNAIKFTQKGQVLVSVQPDPNSAAAGGLKFVVTDTGIGIPADKIHLLFHAFTQADSSTSRKYGGSGLGLAIVSRLVSLMHGKVEVASEPGVGSSFSFTAKFGSANPAQSEWSQAAFVDRVPAIAALPAPSAALNRPLKILIVDDSHDNRALIEAYLKKTPYRLEVAEDGQQAIDKFIAGRFDLVLMDIQMPIVDGYEATTKIRGWERDHGRRRTPVVALTASALEDASDRTMAAGCDAHVTKPVKKSTLLNTIRDAVEGKLLRGNTSSDEQGDSNNL